MPTRLAYTLTGTTFFIEDIKKTHNLLESTSYQRALQEMYEKEIAILEEFYHMDVMLTDDWKDQISNFSIPTHNLLSMVSKKGCAATTLVQLTSATMWHQVNTVSSRKLQQQKASPWTHSRQTGDDRTRHLATCWQLRNFVYSVFIPNKLLPNLHLQTSWNGMNKNTTYLETESNILKMLLNSTVTWQKLNKARLHAFFTFR